LPKEQFHTLDDDALLTLIISQQPGWRDILSMLLQRHHAALFTRCYIYLKNREDAEDTAQETELRVFRAIRNFRGDSSFRTWLFAIADRQCYDMVRKRVKHMIDDHMRALIEIHESSVNKMADETESHTIVNLVLTKLPEQERDIIMLRYYVDLSLHDISSTLGIGLSASKMRLYRALEKFAAQLHREQYIISI
jgi:RNA polymerase sigma-70 factor (ECF subfamily)